MTFDSASAYEPMPALWMSIQSRLRVRCQKDNSRPGVSSEGWTGRNCGIALEPLPVDRRHWMPDEIEQERFEQKFR